MPLSEFALEMIQSSLKRKMSAQEISAVSRTTKSDEIRRDWEVFVQQLQADDEVWEWEWFANPRVDFRASYSLGWCIIRNGEIIDSYCHSFS